MDQRNKSIQMSYKHRIDGTRAQHIISRNIVIADKKHYNEIALLAEQCLDAIEYVIHHSTSYVVRWAAPPNIDIPDDVWDYIEQDLTSRTVNYEIKMEHYADYIKEGLYIYF
ncbi:MAG: hypothetical protein Faunusvirus33_7 [Faunusvirus sp.]|jgi:hypothetical protein|uniref:Uncharacterized protein n=1 Tax=Faunusvirus sp. TaxID=2487766 RepID=A0A3G5A1B2_9VIRU|nr:MAG: hypothetical protein Faunusvirus33_7 [Faunusvirus sp.]